MRGIDANGNDIVAPTDLDDDYLPILWLGPVEYAPDWLPLRKQCGREAPRPSVPPPRTGGAVVRP